MVSTRYDVRSSCDPIWIEIILLLSFFMILWNLISQLAEQCTVNESMNISVASRRLQQKERIEHMGYDSIENSQQQFLGGEDHAASTRNHCGRKCRYRRPWVCKRLGENASWATQRSTMPTNNIELGEPACRTREDGCVDDSILMLKSDIPIN